MLEISIVVRKVIVAAVSRQQLAFGLINTPDVAKNKQGLALKERGAGLTVGYESTISLATFHRTTYLTAIPSRRFQSLAKNHSLAATDRAPHSRRRTPNRASNRQQPHQLQLNERPVHERTHPATMAISGWGVFLIILVLAVVGGAGGYIGSVSVMKPSERQWRLTLLQICALPRPKTRTSSSEPQPLLERPSR